MKNIWCRKKYDTPHYAILLPYIMWNVSELGFIWPVSFSSCAPTHTHTHNFTYEKLVSQSGCSMSCVGQAFSVVLLVFKDYKGCMLTTSRWSVFIVSTQFLSIFLCNYISVCLNYNALTFGHYLCTQWHALPRTARLHNPGNGDKPFRHFTRSPHPLHTTTPYSQYKWIVVRTW